MKKSFLAILFCMAFTAMFAQNSPADKANEATQRMTETLNLDQQQTEQVKAAYLEVFVGTAEIKKSDRATRSAKQHEIQSKFDTDLAKVLTPEQNKQWNESRKNKSAPRTRGKKHDLRKANTDPNARIMSSSNRTADRMKKQLDLSDSQRDMVFEAQKKKLSDIQTLRDNKTDRSEMINAKKRINREYQTTVDGILTTEQTEKRQMIRAKRIEQNDRKLKNGKGNKTGTRKPIQSRKEEKESMRMKDQAAIYTERMTKKLDLTQDQIDPFYQVFLKRVKASKSKPMQMKRTREEADQIILDYRVDLEKILTPEQLKKLDLLNGNKKRSRREENTPR